MHARSITLSLTSIALLTAPLVAATRTIDLAGDDHTGYLSMSNVKNWSTEAGAQAGLPDYPYYFNPGAGSGGADIWTSLVAEPLSAFSTYVEESSFTVQNKTITDVDFSTRSSGAISFDDAGITGQGTETVAASALTFNFNKMGFSPFNSPHNAGSGFGNAGWDYVINASNVAGTGLTFTDGLLTSIDLTADIAVQVRFGGNASLAWASTYDGTLTFNGDSFAFNVNVFQDNLTPFGTFTDTRLVFNRGGTIGQVGSLFVPEPASALMLAMAAVAMIRRRRGR